MKLFTHTGNGAAKILTGSLSRYAGFSFEIGRAPSSWTTTNRPHLRGEGRPVNWPLSKPRRGGRDFGQDLL